MNNYRNYMVIQMSEYKCSTPGCENKVTEKVAKYSQDKFKKWYSDEEKNKFIEKWIK